MSDEKLRKQLIETLSGGHAHATFKQSVEGFPVDKAGVRPPGLPHSAWELLEHIRITQKDILLFSQSSDYKEIRWPEDYWPTSQAPADPKDWDESIRQYKDDLKAFEALLEDTSRDLYEPFAWGQGQTLLREALLIIDHTSYHLGQLLLVRKAQGLWKG